jgi:glycolate oxidase FAD binding subunit
MSSVSPRSLEEASELLRAAGEDRRAVRFVGGGTKLDWGAPTSGVELEVSTTGLDSLFEHNAADLTAVLGAGVPVARAQENFARAGQMLPLDPALGESGAATIGGVVATGDSGPLRHRYGGPRDLLLGITVVLSDGTVARSGGKVIKNVAGYDLAKLFSGSFGTLGLVAEVVVRLRPQPVETITTVGEHDDPDVIRAGARAVALAQLEHESLDVFWSGGSGSGVACRFSGVAPEEQAEAAGRLLREEGLGDRRLDEDDELWNAQRSAQRTSSGAVIRVSALPGKLADVLRAADRAGATVAGRAALGISWLRLREEDADELVPTIEALREELAPAPCVVLDAPETVRRKLDVWQSAEGPETELMRRVKERFDPAGVCNPELFMGGI